MDKLQKLLISVSKNGIKTVTRSAAQCNRVGQKLIKFKQVQTPMFYKFKPQEILQRMQLSLFSTEQQQMRALNEEEKSLLSSLKENPSVIDKIVDLADSYIQQDQIAETLQLYHEAITINPESARLNCMLGSLYVQLEDLQLGVQLLEKGLELDHAEIGEEGLIGLASVYKMLNQNDKAIQTYLRSIELNYLPSYSHQFIALLYAEQSQFDKADEHYKKSLELNPNDFLSQWAYGELIFAKDQEKGIKIMKEAAQNIALKQCDNKFVSDEDIEEMKTSMNFRVGQILQHIIKDIETAKTYYKTSLKNSPDHVESHVQYASCLKQGDDPNLELAEYHLKKAKEIDPSKFQKKLTEWW